MSEATGPAGPQGGFCNKRSGYLYVTSNNRRGRAKRGGGILSPVPHRGGRVAAGVKKRMAAAHSCQASATNAKNQPAGWFF